MVVFYEMTVLIVTIIFIVTDIFVAVMIIKFIKMLSGLSDADCVALSEHVSILEFFSKFGNERGY